MQIDKKFLMKFDRFCAWLLVAVMVGFFVSGYGEVKGIIPAGLSKLLHETLLPVPGAIAFVFHSAYGMHIALKRWKVWGKISMALLIGYAAVIIIGVFYFEFFVQLPGSSITAPQTINLN